MLYKGPSGGLCKIIKQNKTADGPDGRTNPSCPEFLEMTKHEGISACL